MEFYGFPKQAITFFKELSENNNREWFAEHKTQYQETILIPAQAFVLSLGEHLKLLSNGIEYDSRTSGVGSIFRIARDIRFSKDKTPYKTNLGILFWEGPRKKVENPGFYFQLDQEGAQLYSGFYGFPKEYLRAFCEAVDDRKLGSELETILKSILAQDGFELGGERYKRVPAGYDPQHPRADLLKYKGLWAKSPLIGLEVISSSKLVDECFQYAVQMISLHKWLVQIDKLSLT